MKMTVGRARLALGMWILLAILSIATMCWRLVWINVQGVNEIGPVILVYVACYYIAIAFAFLSASRLKALHDAQEYQETKDTSAGKTVSLAMTDDEAAKFDELVVWHRQSKKSRRQIGAASIN